MQKIKSPIPDTATLAETQSRLLYFVLLASPFVFAFQVVFRSYLFSYFLYSLMAFVVAHRLAVVIANTASLQGIKNLWRAMSDFKKTVLLFTLVIATNSVNEIFYFHSVSACARVLLLFVVPLLFFGMLSKWLDSTVALAAIVSSGLLVGIEALHEFSIGNVVPRVTWFQRMEFQYVKDVSGYELTRFLQAARQTGLVEHLHATGFVLAASFLCATIMLLCSKKRFSQYLCLGASLVLCAAMVANGTRLILIGGLASWGMLCVFGKDNRGRLVIQLLLLSLTICLLFHLSKMNEHFWHITYLQYPIRFMAHFFPSEYWSAALEHSLACGAWRNDSITNMFGENYDFFKPFNLTRSLSLLSPANLLFGIGFGRTPGYLGVADDHFFIAQFMWQLGIFGSSAFVAMFVGMCGLALRRLRKADSPLNKEALVLLAFLIIWPCALLHSSVLLRKACWILFCFPIAIALRLDQRPETRLIPIDP